MPVEITSNGHIFETLTPDEIIASSIVMLSISIDGFGDGSYEKLRPGGDYARLRKNIESFYRVQRAGPRRPYLTLRNVLLSRSSEKRADQAARFRAEWQGLCDRISFNDYVPASVAGINEGKPRVCDDILYNLHVEWDGRTPLCTYQHLITDQEYTGDVSKVPVVQAWNDARRKEIRRAHVAADLSRAPFCAKCPKTRQGGVYRRVRDHGMNRSPLWHALERRAWRSIT